MALHLSKFIHTTTGKYIMSLLLGLGLASFFRMSCKGKQCREFYAPSLEEYSDKIQKTSSGKCVKFNPVVTRCNNSKQIYETE